MKDISSDFANLKVTVLQKASQISDVVRQVTIGPHSITRDSEYAENVENEQNECNVIEKEQIHKPLSAKTSMRSGITFSIKKILLENELQRREEVRRAIERRRQQMEESKRTLQKEMAILGLDMAMRRERQKEEDLARLEAEEERISQQTELRRKHEQQLHAQRILERKEKLERETEEHKRKFKEMNELIERIIPFQIIFRTKYQDINTLFKACKNKDAVALILALYTAKMTELNQQMEVVIQKARSGYSTAADVNTVEAVVQQSDEVVNTFKLEIEHIDAMYDAEIARREDEVRKAQIQVQTEAAKIQEMNNLQVLPEEHLPSIGNAGASIDQKVNPNEAVIETSGQAEVVSVGQTILEDKTSQNTIDSSSKVPTCAESEIGGVLEFIDPESLQLYENSQQFLNMHVASYQELLQSDSTKKFRFECQKAVNIPVNAISGVSAEHLMDKYQKLQRLLFEKTSMNVAQYPQGIAYCKDILARKIVSQGETLVSSKPEMAFAVAAVTVALWNDHPDFGELLLAHFYGTCPYMVPIFIPQSKGQSNEEYYTFLGYKYSEDGTVEKQDKFLKRISGLMRLYTSLMVTRQRRGVTKNHPHGIQNAWRWLASVLNIEPRSDICDVYATLILDVLEVAGNALWAAYPNQFPKMLTYLVNQYYPLMQNSSGIGGGPMMRLEEFLKNCLLKGFIPPPEGELSPNFW